MAWYEVYEKVSEDEIWLIDVFDSLEEAQLAIKDCEELTCGLYEYFINII